MRQLDLLIVGSGIAGSCLAVWADRLGLDFHVLDPLENSGSSFIAAGLMSPVTGQELVLVQEFTDHWADCLRFYKGLEKQFQTKFLNEQAILRIFANDQELLHYQKRRNEIYDQYARPYTGPWNPHVMAPWGGLLLQPAGRLLMHELCQQVQNWLINQQRLTQTTASWVHDFTATHEHLIWKPGLLAAEVVIFCDGASYQLADFFPDFELHPSKGEILTLEIPELNESQILVHQTWLVPLGDHYYKLGATYHWDQLDSQPTTAGKEELLQHLSLFIKVPVKVVQHQAAVRPTPRRFRPCTQWSTIEPRLGMINGLGSKGSLLAPALTYQFLKAWCDQRTNSAQ